MKTVENQKALFKLENEINQAMKTSSMEQITEIVNRFRENVMPETRELTQDEVTNASSQFDDELTFTQNLITYLLSTQKTEDVYEILTHEEFWASNPAPGTEYYEHTATSTVVHPSDYDAEQFDPDDVLLVSFSTSELKTEPKYLVVKRGSWDSEEGVNARKAHLASVKHGEAEFGETHHCSIGFDH